MTMCLAAPSFDEAAREYCIVMCADQRFEDEISGGDFGLKFAQIGKRWMAMGCGSVTKVFRIVSALSRFLKDKSITRNSVLRDLEQGSLEHLKSWDEYCEALGIEEEWQCELIVGCFLDHDNEPLLFRIDHQHRVHLESALASIGSGTAAGSTVYAQRFNDPFLKRSNHDEVLTLKESLYYLYEAKRMSEVQGSVGPGTHIAVWTKDGARVVSLDGLETLECWYRYFGLKPFDSGLGLPTTFFS